MNLASRIYRRAIDSRGRARAFWMALRDLMLKVGDRDCTMKVHGRQLTMPLSHQLPLYIALHDLYDTLPARLARFLRRGRDSLCLIDVGANVGDTIAAFGLHPHDTCLAIEPNEAFARYLRLNWPDPQQVIHLGIVCTSGEQAGLYAIDQHRGTASIRPDASGQALQGRPLDNVVDTFEAFRHPDLIKIDTDGHDFEVLAGAMQTIARSRPAVLFECDVFGRPTYAQAALERLEAFAAVGYSDVIVYDNLGVLVGRYALDDRSALAALLFRQLVLGRIYYDMLLLEPSASADFLAAELEFFVEARVQGALRSTASDAARLI